jgi:hypothetical protein
VLAAAALFGVVAFHIVLTQGQLDLQHLQSRAATASVRQQQLRLEAARLESPERVVEDARRLGMVPPSSVRYLTPGGSPITPTPTPAPPKQPKTPPKSVASSVPPRLASRNPTLEASSRAAKTTPTTAAKPVTSSAASPTR